ncbi:MAG: hypothetical protein OHK005_00270 [Candidatus Methylacidiphilales bacterium]
MKFAELARRIVGALDQHLGRPELERLASEYAQACQEVNTRLEQCAKLIKAGSEHQALQVAQSYPPVLDLVAELEFARIDEWRDLCGEEGLTLAEPLDVRTVRRLNEIYAKGLAATDGLYKEYRAARLRRDTIAARSVLERIIRQNPKDENAREEWARLEGEELPLRKSNHRAEEEVETTVKPQVEAAWKQLKLSEPTRRVPDSALKEKAAQRLEEMRAAREASNPEKVLVEAKALKMLLGQRAGVLSEEQKRERRELEDWAEQESQRLRKESEARERVRKIEDELVGLEGWLESGEHREEPVWRVMLARAAELRKEEGEDWTKLPELEERLTRLEADLEKGWKAAREEGRRRRRPLWVAGLAVVVIGTVIVLLNGRVFATQAAVQLALDKGEITKARQELASMEAASWLFVGPQELLKAKRSEFQRRLLEEEERATQVRDMLAVLAQEAAREFSGQPFRQVGRQVGECRDKYQALAREFQEEVAASYTRVMEAWERLVEREREASVQRLAVVLAEVEEIIRKRADFRHDPTEAEKGIEEARPLLAELADFQLPVMAGLRLPVETIERAKRAQVHIENVAAEVKKLREAKEQMRQAGLLGEYQAALEVVAGSQFLESEIVDEARRVARRGLSEESFAARAIMPASPGLWRFVREESNRPLYPDKPTDRERALYLGLRDEVDLRDIYRCLVSPLPPGQSEAERTIYSRGQPTRRDSTISDTVVRSEWVAEFYDPARHPSAIQFESVPIGFSFVNRRQNDLRLVESSLTMESDLFRRIGLGDWIDRSTGNFQMPVLRLLDQVRSEPKANPLFVTHVFLRLMDVVSERPESWGIQLSPSLQEQARELRTALSLAVLPTDWMVPRRREMFEARLKQILDAGRKKSFQQEAEVLRAFYGAAAREGFQFSGFVTLDGRVEVRPGSGGALELWGLEELSLRPALLFRREKVGSDWEQVRQPQPLTPLLAIRTDRRQLWRDTVQKLGLAPDDPLVQEMRPEFVRADHGR